MLIQRTKQLTLKDMAVTSWALSAFFLPLGTAPTLLFSYIGLMLSLFVLRVQEYKYLFDESVRGVCVALLVFFFLLLTSAIWTVAPNSEALEAISKYRRIPAALVLFLLLSTDRRHVILVVKSYLYGILAYLAGVMMSILGFWEFILGPPTGAGWPVGPSGAHHWFLIGLPNNPTFGKNHISGGLLLCSAALLFLGLALAESDNHGRRRRLYLALSAVATFACFNLQGRTGYLLILIGVPYLLYKTYFNASKYFYTILWVTLISTVLSIVTNFDSLLPRISQAADDVASFFSDGSLHSQGVRLQLWKTGLQAYWSAPSLFGFGVGSYAEIFERTIASVSVEQAALRELAASRPQPHSEFIQTLVQTGPVGIVLLTAAFSSILRRLGDSGLYVSQALCVVLIIDGFFNSVIFDLTEGQFFVFLVGCSLAEIFRINGLKRNTTTRAEFC